MVEQITGMLALIGVLSLFCQWLGWKLRLPAILPLLLCGLTLGPGLGFLNPDAIFGNLLFPIISLGVAVILFEGALTLNFKEIKDHGRMVTHLVTIGTVITWACISTATFYLLDFSWEIALLFGALVVVTGPTVIVPMLRSVRPKSQLASILRWEGIVIDPIGALLAVLVFEYITVSGDQTTHVLYALGSMLSLGLGLGAAAGYLTGQILRRNLLPHYLRNTAVLTLMLGIFVGSNLLQEESGLLTVTVMGIWLANMRGVDIAEILEFKETLTVLLISALFILLAARLDSNAMLDLGWGGLGVLAVTMLLARPLSIWVSGVGTSLSRADKWFLCWIAPRGIVAAAVSSLFAIKLEANNVQGADAIVPLVFLIIIGTVVIQSLTAGRWARFLGVKADSAQGLLIFGASKFSRELAKILKAKDVKVLLADNNWDNIRLARMDNIPVYFGNPASEHAETYMDLTGIGLVLIISPYRQLNPLVSFHFQDFFGTKKVFGLNNTEVGSARHQLSETYKQRLCLFGDAVSYAKIASLMARGAQLKVTNLTENFSFEHFRKRYGETAMPLVYLTKEGKVVVVSGNDTVFPNGIELISLLPIEALEEAKVQQAIAEREAQEAQEKSAAEAALAKAKAEEEAEQLRLEKSDANAVINDEADKGVVDNMIKS
ncbi:cation:proton antiporter [Shewanella baltica]|uniref:Sodium/hydrogen exchanger n=1 Tax=Shewanella baltica (strain OS155 / ATCC BAA-1091) TaxID=325240 RepID=A3D4Z0_SHEB5|nr:sodium:proton antiporter [Shewanella baltica]ABN61803.1 sodium/hydrogen exchanger [Shewanella baltica OS155]AEH14153.1 sodium/hydrogen exchanger [Shewanella baltica OS117]